MSDVPHLNQLFRTGKEIKILVEPPDADPIEVSIWMRAPSHEQQEQAISKGRAKQARRKLQLKDKESDEYLSLVGDLDDMVHEDLVDQLFEFNSAKTRQEAYNIVLHEELVDEEGNKTSRSSDYIDLVLAQESRLAQIEEHNNALVEGAEKLFPEDDEELQVINAALIQFNEAIDERFAELEAEQKAKLRQMTDEQLRAKLIKDVVSTDSSLIWYEEYKRWMVYFACRRMDDHKKLYFNSVDEMWELPDWIRQRLIREWDTFENPIADVKNSLAPLNSLLS